MDSEHARNLIHAREQGRKLLASLDLTPQDREWAERHGEDLISLWSKGLTERLEVGISFDAIPAVFAYALAVVQSAYEIGKNQPPVYP